MSTEQGIPLTNGEVPKLTFDDYSAYKAEGEIVTPHSQGNLHRSSDDRRSTTATPIVRSSAQRLNKKSIDGSLRDPVGQLVLKVVSTSQKQEDHDEEDDEDDQEQEKGLGHVLRDSGHRHFDTRVKHFWTDDVLTKTMTKPCIVGELQRYQRENPALFATKSIETVADDILKYRRKIFAVLAILDKGSCIEEVIAEGLVDKDLPLHTKGSPSVCPLYRYGTDSTARKVKCFSRPSWKTLHRETFLTSQYAMSPQFLGFDSDGHTPKHEDFSAGAVLPIIEEQERHQGGYGAIKKIKLARASHGFHNRLRLIKTDDEFALKRLLKNDALEFRREAKAGERFNGFVCDHLVTLLMTWTLNDQYYLLFPLARYDLEEYWSHYKSPQVSPSMACWMLKQIVGITAAVEYIHDPPGSQPADTLGVRDDREYGRHGDIKPDNLLWCDSPKDRRGIVVVADLGLATLNSVVSRTQSNTKTRCAPRYKAPEFNMKGFKIRRSCDVWALGCVLIEWVCWALEGNDARVQFLTDLFQPFPSGSQTDLYFEMERKQNKIVNVTVNRAVAKKVDRLHRSKHCTQLFHDLLWLIQDNMIVVRAENRISAQELHRELKKMAERGTRDSRYYDNACETPRVPKLPPPLEATFYVQETKKGALNHFELDVPQ
ncbi:hypothetical protein HBH64_008060 [Parastagonospora nodorum]|nr:hypothetical protein HBI03_080850 [Parastagonospora nodorum]KAH4283140.1 hypothetical protein HBI04_019260 [Parastagonospora nodorum]KAH4312551.1 hypothetical protein HBI01_005600 [Parastagonospora nodorum]KAH4316368.1 hypothetical protein HBI02_043200 [Parastagonospora nodorum]KAH4332376.1 hypothetical protein HBI00_057650 [Parastagonospora nodorum]